MMRRDFLAGSLLAAAGSGSAGAAEPKKRTPEWYELRTYHLRLGQTKVLNDFLAEVALPALRRLGVGPVGALETTFGPETPALRLLIPVESPAAAAALPARLAADPAYHKGAAAVAYHDAPGVQPPYQRMDSVLLSAFERFPRLEPPATDKPRIFELRTYESPSEAAHLRKMEMFTKMGELELFRRAGLTPVFFARTVIGPRQPNFMYMLTFPDLATRDKAWAAFRADPEWQKLKATPGYTDTDTMSNITDLVLRPAPYSQL
jgi:hypothetical protein